MSADLSGLDLVAFVVDGVHFAEHVCVVALGITIDGTKVPLAIEEGSTENVTLVTALPPLPPPLPSWTSNLRSRTCSTTR